MDIDLGTATLLLGALLGVAAGLSGWLHGTVLSISVLSVVAGIVLSFADVLTVTPGAALVVVIVEVALILRLFSDGLVVERELLQTQWHAPARALAVAMPMTLALFGVAAKMLFPDLSWAEAFLLGAVLRRPTPSSRRRS